MRPCPDPAGPKPRELMRLLLGLMLVGFAPNVLAQAGVTVNSAPAAGGGTTYSVPIQTMLAFAALSFLPAVLLLMTSFTRIVIVLSLLRQAMGLQTPPPNQVVIGLSLFLSLFVMGPTLDRIHDDAWKPYNAQTINLETALERGSGPLRSFMLKQTRESDLALFSRIARLEEGTRVEETPMRVLIPAFVIVASVLMSMGMMMLSPVLVALPFKLMLFVLADGWTLLVGSLVASFG